MSITSLQTLLMFVPVFSRKQSLSKRRDELMAANHKALAVLKEALDVPVRAAKPE
ncbi:MAG: hypothetical protein PW790_12685 [Parvibaculaceae bacterium]|nr:hypothetical protein [Parvibaculaceae bacterium]